MPDPIVSAVRSSLAGMIEGPSGLAEALAFYGKQLGALIDEAAVAVRVEEAEPDDPVLLEFMQVLARWDAAANADWAADTLPESATRRDLIYVHLGIQERLRRVLAARAPFYQSAESLIVIADEHRDWSAQPYAQPGYYWRGYLGYLGSVKHWETVGDLELSTKRVLDRLADPRQMEAWQSRGLVVGYVQSGKTSNFTGVIARAADAGYRLFIIVSGRTDILRHQTQRRLDKELLGQELVGEDYNGDPDWPQFRVHGALPSTIGQFDWERMTGPYDADYRSLGPRIHALRFTPSAQRGAAAYPYEQTAAKLIVVKKNAAVLGHLARDIGRVSASLVDVPALVVDDESDEASVNTKNPSRKDLRERTAVNKAVTELLAALPRAQYVGYTATPAANILIDPSDAEDLFPRDFLIGLRRPKGYMGASDFHDLDGPPDDFHFSKKWAYVRDVLGDDGDPENLQSALDAFVLAGAIRLWRAEGDVGRVGHHTMLVHITQRTTAQAVIAAQIEGLIDEAGYHGESGLARLQGQWDDDFRPRSAAAGARLPEEFEELIPYIGQCLSEIEAKPPRVRIVNGQKPEDTPDFDQERIWKILVGGNKLSRGYTVEGLTVSYYRRRARTADTLMQMGRWCGYRPGYQDLVRLFIGRRESEGRNGFVDLYSLYEGAVRDELALRRELQRYSTDEEPRTLPRDVPPLIEASLGIRLLPTNRSKMYNAEAKYFNFGSQRTEKVGAPFSLTDVNWNEGLGRNLVRDARIDLRTIGMETGRGLRAWVGPVDTDSVLRFLREYRWLDGARSLAHELDYLNGRYGDPEIGRWLFFAPQQRSAKDSWRVDDRVFDIQHHARRGGAEMAYTAYSGSRDREIAAALAGLSAVPSSLAQYVADKQAVITLIPTRDFEREGFTSMGFAIQYPRNGLPVKSVFGPRDTTQPTALIVDAT